MTSVSIFGGGTTSMQYDYTGMRVKKDAPTGMTLFPFKGYEIASDGTITKFIRIGIETFASKKRTSGGATTQYFYHNDHLGGVNVITDGSGARCQLNEYDPWGGVSRSEGATPGTPATCDPTHRFTGREVDPESGLYYYGGRYYDQEISRFVSPDPFVQSPDDPQNLNRYSYVFNNPQGYIDPTGYDGEDTGGSYSYSIPLYGWVRFFMDLFSSDEEPDHRPKRRKNVGAPPSHHELTVKNGGQGKLENVLVYDSQPSPWSEDPNWGTGNPGNDNPNGSSWWTRICIGPCDARVQTQGKPPAKRVYFGGIGGAAYLSSAPKGTTRGVGGEVSFGLACQNWSCILYKSSGEVLLNDPYGGKVTGGSIGAGAVGGYVEGGFESFLGESTQKSLTIGLGTFTRIESGSQVGASVGLSKGVGISGVEVRTRTSPLKWSDFKPW